MKTKKASKTTDNRSGGIKGAIILSLFFMIMSYIAGIPLSNASGRLQYEIVDLSSEKNDLVEKNESLQSKVWELSSLSRLSKKAEEFEMGPVDLKELKIIAPEVVQDEDDSPVNSSANPNLPLDITSVVPSENPIPSTPAPVVEPTTAPEGNSGYSAQNSVQESSAGVYGVPTVDPTSNVSDPTSNISNMVDPSAQPSIAGTP